MTSVLANNKSLGISFFKKGAFTFDPKYFCFKYFVSPDPTISSKSRNRNFHDFFPQIRISMFFRIHNFRIGYGEQNKSKHQFSYNIFWTKSVDFVLDSNVNLSLLVDLFQFQNFCFLRSCQN